MKGTKNTEERIAAVMDISKLREEALAVGFTLAEPMKVETIKLRDEVREMCAVNKCHAYNTNGCRMSGTGRSI